MKVVGLDICKSSVAACVLTERPLDVRQFYYGCKFYRFNADASGIKALLELEPDIAIMEPTGVNYARLWGTHLARVGIEVRLVGHKELRRYRENHLGLPDKDDDADALALACYLFDYFDSPRRFVQIRDRITTRLRELILRLAHLNRVQSPLINRLRQDLAWQFPEAANINSNSVTDVPPLWAWLAGERSLPRYENLYADSAGLGLSETVKLHAQRLCHLQREERGIEQELLTLMAAPQFDPYRRVFAEFGFGDRIQGLLLSQIYPLENYLDADGKPEVIIRRGRNSGKASKRHLSLRRFQKSLGVAPTEESSGDKRKSRVVGGSDLCRKALWQWLFTRIEPKRCRPKNEIGQELGKELDEEKAQGRPVKLVRSRLMAKAARLLFKKLVETLGTRNG